MTVHSSVSRETDKRERILASVAELDAYLDAIGGAVVINADSNNRLPNDITGSTVTLRLKRRSSGSAPEWEGQPTV